MAISVVFSSCVTVKQSASLFYFIEASVALLCVRMTSDWASQLSYLLYSVYSIQYIPREKVLLQVYECTAENGVGQPVTRRITLRLLCECDCSESGVTLLNYQLTS